MIGLSARLAAAIPAFKNLAKACTNPAIATWLALPQPEAEVGHTLNFCMAIFSLFSFCSQGLDEVPGFSFVNLFRSVDPSFSTALGMFCISFSLFVTTFTSVFHIYPFCIFH